MTIGLATGLEPAILAWWAATPAVNGLLDSGNVYTDDVEDEKVAPPYVVLKVESDRALTTSSRTFYRADITFEIYHELNGYDEARQLNAMLTDYFEDFAVVTLEVAGQCPSFVSSTKPDEDSGRKHWSTVFEMTYSITR